MQSKSEVGQRMCKIRFNIQREPLVRTVSHCYKNDKRSVKPMDSKGKVNRNTHIVLHDLYAILKKHKAKKTWTDKTYEQVHDTSTIVETKNEILSKLIHFTHKLKMRSTSPATSKSWVLRPAHLKNNLQKSFDGASDKNPPIPELTLETRENYYLSSIAHSVCSLDQTVESASRTNKLTIHPSHLSSLT